MGDIIYLNKPDCNEPRHVEWIKSAIRMSIETMKREIKRLEKLHAESKGARRRHARQIENLSRSYVTLLTKLAECMEGDARAGRNGFELPAKECYLLAYHFVETRRRLAARNSHNSNKGRA